MAQPEEGQSTDSIDPPAAVVDAPPKRKRRWLIVGIVAAAVVLLVAAGIGTFVLLDKPERPTEVVDAYLRAVRDGDLDRAVGRWNDLEPYQAGVPGLRQRVRTYLDSHEDAYRKALSGRQWISEQYQARLGTGVNVKLGAATVTYLLVGSDKDGWEIMLGPEDTLGRPSPDGNALLTVA